MVSIAVFDPKDCEFMLYVNFTGKYHARFSVLLSHLFQEKIVAFLFLCVGVSLVSARAWSSFDLLLARFLVFFARKVTCTVFMATVLVLHWR